VYTVGTYTMYFEYDKITMCFVLLQDGWTPLHHAALNDHVVVIEYLLNKGAKINYKDDVRYLMYSQILKFMYSVYCMHMG